jgi:hypothetical protein
MKTEDTNNQTQPTKRQGSASDDKSKSFSAENEGTASGNCVSDTDPKSGITREDKSEV